MTFPTSTQSGYNVEPTEPPYGVWMTPEVHEELMTRATPRQTRITWPECVFGIFLLFFICVALGIIFQ